LNDKLLEKLTRQECLLSEVIQKLEGIAQTLSTISQVEKDFKLEHEQQNNILQNILDVLKSLPDRQIVEDALIEKKFDTNSSSFWVQKTEMDNSKM
jgi:hypothetical protein